MVGPQAHVAQVTADQLAQQFLAGHLGGQRLRFAMPGNGQALAAKLGHGVHARVLDGVADETLAFPVGLGGGIELVVLVQRLQRLLAQAMGVRRMRSPEASR